MSNDIQELIARVAGDFAIAGAAVAFGGLVACYLAALFLRILRKNLS